MRTHTCVALFAIVAIAHSVAALAGDAEGTVAARFGIGSGDGQVGVIADIPDRAPEGPAAIAISPSDEVFALLQTQQGTVESRFDRESKKVARVALAGSGRSAEAPADLQIKSKHFLASGELVAVDAHGRYYVLAEEMLSDQPELAVHTVLARYSSSGELQGVADLPLDALVFLPNRYVAVSSKGKAYFLEPTDREVRILKLRFEKRASVSREGERSAIIGASRAAAPAADGEFEGVVRDLYADDTPPTTTGAISRARILENANRYLHLSWSLTPQNYEQEGGPTKCNPPAGLWKRPPRLDGKVNQKVQALPYRWGGYESLQGFQDKLKKGYLAGDVCTCRKSEYGYCISKRSTGVDCSGFVSRVLEEKYHTTSRLHKVADRLPSFHDLRPGDFLNRAGRHVRLFVGFAEDGPFALKTIESAVKCGGICEASYRVSQLNGYVPMRYKYVED